MDFFLYVAFLAGAFALGTLFGKQIVGEGAKLAHMDLDRIEIAVQGSRPIEAVTNLVADIRAKL